MELRQLRYFAAVAKTLSFTEAARQLYISQSTLSQQLKQLESELGSELFARTSRNVSLTEAGLTLLPMAIHLLETSEHCKTQMGDLQSGVSGELKIGVSESVKMMVGTAAREFLKRYPGVSLQIHCHSALHLLEMLRNKELDLIVTLRLTEPPEDLIAVDLFQTELSVVMDAGHCLAGRPSLTLEDLEKFELVFPGGGLQARRELEKYFSISVCDTRQCTIINDIDLIFSMVRNSSRVAILSSSDVWQRKGFVAVPLIFGDGTRKKMICCALRLKGFYSKRSANLFMEIIEEQASLTRIDMGV